MRPTAAQEAATQAKARQWDGKCRQCRKLMSRCVCFQDDEADPTAATPTTSKADWRTPEEIRPLWNALRKMHHKAPAAGLLPTRSSGVPTSSNTRKPRRSEARPPLGASSSTSAPRESHSRRVVHSQASSTRRERRQEPRREPKRESSPMKAPRTREEKLQLAGVNVGSTTPSENFIYEPSTLDEDDDAVWEL